MSILSIIFAPAEWGITQLLSGPAYLALFAAILQISRDQVSFERSFALQSSQNGFVLGASSHMANIAFDKHVEFSEEYVREAHLTIRTLFKEGPTGEALNHANNLTMLRQKYFIWLTSDLDGKLSRLESALRKLGAGANFVKHDTGTEAQQRAIAGMYLGFANLLGRDIMGTDSWQGDTLSEDDAINKVIFRFRIILGTEELTKLRSELIKNAVANLNSPK